MKAKVIKTGEIVEVYYEPQQGQITNIYKEAVFVNGRMWEEDELDFSINSEPKEVDLEKEFYDFLDTLIGKDNGHLSEDELFSIAKYFFELGLSISNKAMKGE